MKPIHFISLAGLGLLAWYAYSTLQRTKTIQNVESVVTPELMEAFQYTA